MSAMYPHTMQYHSWATNVDSLGVCIYATIIANPLLSVSEDNCNGMVNKRGWGRWAALHMEMLQVVGLFHMSM